MIPVHTVEDLVRNRQDVNTNWLGACQDCFCIQQAELLACGWDISTSLLD